MRNLLEELKEGKIHWERTDLFVAPKSDIYDEKDKIQLGFIIDVIKKLYPKCDISTKLEDEPGMVYFSIYVKNEEKAINYYHPVWAISKKDERYIKLVKEYGSYWGAVKYILKYLPISNIILLSYFKETVDEPKYGMEIYDYVGGEKRTLYVRVKLGEYGISREISVYTEEDFQFNKNAKCLFTYEEPIIQPGNFYPLNNK